MKISDERAQELRQSYWPLQQGAHDVINELLDDREELLRAVDAADEQMRSEARRANKLQERIEKLERVVELVRKVMSADYRDIPKIEEQISDALRALDEGEA